MRVDNPQCPGQGDEHEEYVDRCEEVVLEPKLEISKREIECEVEEKRQGDDEGQFPSPCFPEYCAECVRDDCIQHAPHRAE